MIECHIGSQCAMFVLIDFNSYSCNLGCVNFKHDLDTVIFSIQLNIILLSWYECQWTSLTIDKHWFG